MLCRNSIPRILAYQFARAKGRNVFGSRYDGDRRYCVWAMCGTIGASDRTYGKIGPYEFYAVQDYKRANDLGAAYVPTGITIMLCKSYLHEDPSTAVTIEYV